jgi:phytoene dehydrogenase-like protein
LNTLSVLIHFMETGGTSKMADKSYDAIVIGGGHHGTTIAPYLAKAGLSVGVFERLDHLGGGAVSFDDSPAPGFRGNFCAHFTRYYGHPAYKEFNLREEGLEYVFPDTNEAAVFDDGTSYVAYAGYKVVDPKTGKTEYSERKRQERPMIRLPSSPRPTRKPISTGRKNTTTTFGRRFMNTATRYPRPTACRMPWKTGHGSQNRV